MSKEWNIFDELAYRLTKSQMNRIIRKNNRIIEKYKKEGISIPKFDVSPKNEEATHSAEEVNDDTVEDIINEIISENTTEDDSPIIIVEDNDDEEVDIELDTTSETSENVVEEVFNETSDTTESADAVNEEPIEETVEVIKEQTTEESVVDYGSLVDVIRHGKINTESKKAFIESVYKQTQYPSNKIMVSVDDENGTGDFTIRRNISEDLLTEKLDWANYALSVVGYTGDEIDGFTIEDNGPVDGFVKTFTIDSNKGYTIILFFSDSVTEVVSKKNKKKEKKAAKRSVQIMWIYKISE